jgi:hypothetical protein
MSISRRSSLVDITVVVVLCCASLFAIVRIGTAPKDTMAAVAVIYPPWTTPTAALVQATSAGSLFVRFGAFSFIAIVVPQSPDYVQRVLRGPAWFVVDPQALGGCFDSQHANTSEKQ